MFTATFGPRLFRVSSADRSGPTTASCIDQEHRLFLGFLFEFVAFPIWLLAEGFTPPMTQENAHRSALSRDHLGAESA